MSDEEILKELWEYDELSYDDMPNWLQQECQARYIVVPSRNPTEREKHDTVIDAKQHRNAYNERIVDDFKDKYLHNIKGYKYHDLQIKRVHERFSGTQG